uniref:Uncharacterized protein n=1 Tax=Alexandrium catenella TaxID=2925 RepID=A0A7S1RVD7_ALECA
MAYALRLINNNTLPWGNGRDSHYLGDPSFVHGKVSHGGLPAKGRAPSEVLQGKRVQQLRLGELAATGTGTSQSSRARGVPGPAVLKRWRTAHEAPSAGFAMGLRAPPRPDDLEAGALGHVRNDLAASFPTDEEVLPPKLRLETFPVPKYRTFSEGRLRTVAPQHPGERPAWLREPAGPRPDAGGPTAHHWFSERKVPHTLAHHRAASEGLLESRSRMPLAFTR